MAEKRKDFSPEERCLLEQLRNIPAANIADALGGQVSSLGGSIKPFNCAPLLGIAFPIECPAGDNLTFHCALELAQPGDVIVVTNGGGMDRAMCGEMMALYAKSRKISGFVVDGCIRDAAVLSEYKDFPIYARGCVPVGPDKEKMGRLCVPVQIDQCLIRPGDILLGDQDGILVIAREFLAAAVEKGTACMEKEEKTLAAIREGQGFHRPFLTDAMEKVRSSGWENQIDHAE